MSTTIRYRGQEHVVEEGKTVAQVKRDLGVPQDYILVDDRGRKLRDNERVDQTVADGSGVMPLVQPRYG